MSKPPARWLVIGGIAVILLIVVATLVFYRRPTSEPTSVVANGSVEATEVVLGAKIPGRLIAVNVDEGDTIAKGALVARLDSDEVRAQAQAADAAVSAAAAQVVVSQNALTELERQVQEASLARSYSAATTTASVAQSVDAVAAAEHGVHAAEASFEKARVDFKRMSELFRSGDIAAMQYDAYKTAYENASAQRDQARQALQQARAASAQAQAGTFQVAIREQGINSAEDRIRQGRAALNAARAQLRSAQANRAQVAAEIADTTIRAPSDGTVLRVISHAGEVLAAGTPILTMADMRKLYVRVYVSEQNVPRVRVGDPVPVSVDGYPNRPFAGHVASVDQSAQFTPKTVHMPDERTRLVYGVRVSLDDRNGYLKPGMVADARLPLADPKP